MKEINDPEAWWETANEHKEHIFALYLRFISAGTSRDHFDKLYADSDHKGLLSLMNNIWTHAPDAHWIHSLDGWYELCSLLSESWVFNDDHE